MMSAHPRRPDFRKTATFIFIAIIASSFGNLLLALGMGRMPVFSLPHLGSYILLLLKNPFLLPGALLTAVFMFAQLSLLSWADLSYVIPCTAASYVLTTLLSWLVLQEPVHAARWVGVLLICAGVLLVARTPTRTISNAAGR